MSDMHMNGPSLPAGGGEPASGYNNDNHPEFWDHDLDDRTWDDLDEDWLYPDEHEISHYIGNRPGHSISDDYDGFTDYPPDYHDRLQELYFSNDRFAENEIQNTEIPPEMQSPDMEEITKAVFTHYVDSSLDEAENKYGEEFQEAFQLIIESSDAGLAQRILKTDDPGEELMRVFRQAKMLHAIPDGNLEQWAQKHIDGLVQQKMQELLEDIDNSEVNQTDPVSDHFPPPSILHAPGSCGAYRATIPLSAVTYAFGE